MSQTLRKCPENFAETAIDDEVVLMDMTNGDFFSIKDTGLAIWNLIDGSRGRDDVLATLADSYSVAADEIAADVDDFLTQVQAAGFVAAGCSLARAAAHGRSDDRAGPRPAHGAPPPVCQLAHRAGLHRERY